jgi:hypothetical protein
MAARRLVFVHLSKLGGFLARYAKLGGCAGDAAMANDRIGEPDSQVRNSLIRHLSNLAGLFRAISIPSRRNFRLSAHCAPVAAMLQQSDLFANISAAGRKPRRTSGGRQ